MSFTFCHFTLASEIPMVDENCWENANSMSEMTTCADSVLKQTGLVFEYVFSDLDAKLNRDDWSGLIENQKKWLQSSSADCKWESSLFDNGSMATITEIICLTDKTKNRIEWLSTFVCPAAGIQDDCSRKLDILQAAKI